MAAVKVFRHVPRNHSFIEFEQVQIAGPHPGCDFEANMQHLAKTAVVGSCSGNVTESRNVLLGRPTANLVRRRKLRRVNVDHGGVRRRKFIAAREGFGINLLGQRQTVATGFCQADQLFQPRGSGGFEVHTCLEPLHRGMNGRVDRKLITARVDAQFEIFGQAILLDCICDGRNVEHQLSFELRHVAYVLHTFVETAAELRSDGLEGNTFIRDCRKDDQQVCRALRAIGLVQEISRMKLPAPMAFSILR
jgi:hypothetical protein